MTEIHPTESTQEESTPATVTNKSAETVRASVGIMAHNEEANIGALISALLGQIGGAELIEEIVVVSSGSNDSTESIVREFVKHDSRVKLLTQERRRGKASAINLFLRHSTTPIAILQSADTLPLPDTITTLLEPFKCSSVGMTGAHPIPSAVSKNSVGFGIQCMWSCHHLRNLASPEHPKLGELVAFRRVFREICEKSAVDEADIEAIIQGKGLRRVYCGGAIVLNAGPDSLREFFTQRYRIHRGNIDLKRRTGYQPLTGHWGKILFWSVCQSKFNLGNLAGLVKVGFCEVASLLLANLIMLPRKDPPYVWKMVATGKRPLPLRGSLQSASDQRSKAFAILDD